MVLGVENLKKVLFDEQVSTKSSCFFQYSLFTDARKYQQFHDQRIEAESTPINALVLCLS